MPVHHMLHDLSTVTSHRRACHGTFLGLRLSLPEQVRDVVSGTLRADSLFQRRSLMSFKVLDIGAMYNDSPSNRSIMIHFDEGDVSRAYKSRGFMD